MPRWKVGFKNNQTFGIEHMTPPHDLTMICSSQLWLFSSGDHKISQVDTISQICADLPHMKAVFIFVRPKWFIFWDAFVKTPGFSPRNSLKRDVAEVQEKVSLHSKANDEQRSIQQVGTSSRSGVCLEYHMKYFEIKKSCGNNGYWKTMKNKCYKVLQVVRSQFLSGTLQIFLDGNST